MGQLHVFFFPDMAHGHLIPTLDMAKHFSSRGVKSTIITTPLNVSVFLKGVERAKLLGHDIDIRVIEFPGIKVGLPAGVEHLNQINFGEDIKKYLKATALFQEPLEQLLQQLRPDCLIADMNFTWATEAASKFDIPRLVFHGMGFFSLCAMETIRRHTPYKDVESDDEPILIPHLPHQIKLTKMQVAPYEREEIETEISRVQRLVRESELSSYGVVVNSFYELEPDYADHFRNVLGRRAWHIGPLSLCNREIEDKTGRGNEPAIDEHECLKWLNSKKPNSVVYLCFGSMAKFSQAQLHEMALGIEDSEQDFIWAINTEHHQIEINWMPPGFEERNKDKGLIIRGWAPQVTILDHEAVGAFVTHCGWNSTMEGVCAGVPLVTWPLFAEQFYNEKLVTEILRSGVPVGVREWKRVESDGVKREAVAAAVRRVMVGEECEEIRGRARALREKAWRAVEEGGSSYSDLSGLIEELTSYSRQKKF